MTNWQERIDCRFPPGTHPGILLIRARNKGRDAVMAILRRILLSVHWKVCAVAWRWRLKSTLGSGARMQAALRTPGAPANMSVHPFRLPEEALSPEGDIR